MPSHPEVFAQVHPPHVGVLDDDLGCPFGQHTPFADDVGVVADAQRFAHVVVGDEHADAARLEKADDALDLDHGDRVHAGEGFVQQDEARLGRQRACDLDAAAFAGRSMAADLHRNLESAAAGCTRLAIHAVTVDGAELVRVWRCAEPLTEDATADRIRWQLDGWLNRRNPGDRPTGPIATLRLEPVEVISAEALQLPLWGAGDEARVRARRALVRVQGLLGPEAVQVPVLSGGRGPAERISYTALGDEPVPRADPAGPWPGRLPEPAPTVLADDPVQLLDATGDPVRVTGRGLFSAEPAQLAGRYQGALRWWAGPWPVDEWWWDRRHEGAGRAARAQVLIENHSAAQDSGLGLLLCYRRQQWHVEGVYE